MYPYTYIDTIFFDIFCVHIFVYVHLYFEREQISWKIAMNFNVFRCCCVVMNEKNVKQHWR